MSRPDLSLLLRGLPSFPSSSDLAPIIDLVVAHAEVRAHPLKSAAALLRKHRGGTGVSDEVIASISKAAKQRILSSRRARATPRIDAEHCGEATAAALLGIPREQLRQRLIDPGQRRALGYPDWDGTEFRFPLLALRGATRHASLAALPEAEPLPELLPPWCRRG
jgi:hypothetical protein